MPRFAVKVFGGERPRTDPRLLQDTEAQLARNTKLWAGNLKPFAGGLQHAVPTKQGSGTVLSIYRWGAVAGNLASGHWLNWLTDVDVIRGPVRGDTEERTYWTGDGVPKMSYVGVITGADLPNASYTLGIPVPASGTTVTNSGSGGAAEDLVERNYAITYVSAKGEEGPPVFTADVDWYPGYSVDLASMPSGPSGAYNITNKRIYRAVTGAAADEYRLVAEVGVATASYNDSVDDADLGEALPSATWDAPPTDMASLGVMPNGICYGISKNQLCPSEPFLPHAWNPLNRYTADYDFVAAGHYENTIVAVTEKNPHLVTGINPDSLDGAELPINHGCISKRSLCVGPWGVGYASPTGYVVINGGGHRVISDEYFTEDEWAALDPSTMLAVPYNGRLFIFYDDGSTQGAIIFDPMTPGAGLIRLNQYATAAYHDRLAKELFLVIGNNIVRWDDGTALTYLWRSRVVVSPRPDAPTAARVLADSYASLTFRLYADGALKHTETVTSAAPFRLPGNYHAREFYIELEGTDTVSQVDLADAVSELAGM